MNDNSKKAKSIDLTTADGAADAIRMSHIAGLTAGIAWIAPIFPAGTALAALGKLAYDYFTKRPPTREQQAELVGRILHAGRDSNVSELEVTIDHDVGLHIGANLPPDLAALDIKFKVGSANKTVIRAKYRDA